MGSLYASPPPLATPANPIPANSYRIMDNLPPYNATAMAMRCAIFLCMDLYFSIKTLHIISSTVLFGTGLGIAFFMFTARYAKNIHEKYYAARFTVLADYLFTAPAVILQPASGLWLVFNGGYDPMEPWLVWSYALYILAGLCWLPVVWLQIRMKQLLAQAVQNNKEPPALYHRYFKIWFALGWPAFISLIVIFYLMVAKPA